MAPFRSAGVPGVFSGPDCRSSALQDHPAGDLVSPCCVPLVRRYASGKAFRWGSSPQGASLDLVRAAEQRHLTATLGANRCHTYLRSRAGRVGRASLLLYVRRVSLRSARRARALTGRLGLGRHLDRRVGQTSWRQSVHSRIGRSSFIGSIGHRTPGDRCVGFLVGSTTGWVSLSVG
ncbi:hypothetical protein NDU88_003530 [Pleurodeles waltl]|uniref:Uncharacterized protein n=1 Tax=Pleurodeles waltl TaxID=8319 RepID=A0AAV7T6E4_PLEWA|nr:hypothetical protein NDU88_003530 [Pleurodeles waltl]